MPKFRVNMQVSLSLDKDVVLRAFKDDTEEDVVERAKKRLAVPRKVSKGFKLTDVRYEVLDVSEGDGTWECSLQATLIARGEVVYDEVDAATAKEVAEEEIWVDSTELAGSVFEFLQDPDADLKGWNFYDEAEAEVLEVLPWRRPVKTEGPVPA